MHTQSSYTVVIVQWSEVYLAYTKATTVIHKYIWDNLIA